MTTIATIATIAAAGLAGGGAIAEGRASEKQSKFQADVGKQQATRERQISEAEETDFRRRNRALLASKRAAMGASGVDISAGSPLLAFGDFAAEAELQAQRIRSGGEVRATRLEQQAELDKMAGRQAKRRGFSRAGASLLSGASRAFG